MRAESGAASRLSKVSRPWESWCISAAARSGSRTTSASRPIGGWSSSSAMDTPRGVGAAVWAGRTKANRSSRSKAGPGRMFRRRKVAGACTRIGGGRVFQQGGGIGGGQHQKFAVRCQDGGSAVTRDHGGGVGQRDGRFHIGGVAGIRACVSRLRCRSSLRGEGLAGIRVRYAGTGGAVSHSAS